MMRVPLLFPSSHLPRAPRPWVLVVFLSRYTIAFAALVALLPQVSPAQGSGDALGAVRDAVKSELAADNADHSAWMYLDHDVQPDHDTISQVIETPKGDLHRTLVRNGTRLTGNEAASELARIHTFVNSPEEQAKRRKDGAHDGDQARELLTMLPDAFLWTVASQNAEEILLRFRPNPAFHPGDMQARVLGIMAGEMIVARNGQRIRTLRGTLSDDVRIGFGILGKLDKGGTFDVERRQIAPGHWQITDTHVHIAGHALLFKSIGTREDETKTEFKPSTAPDLQTAEEQIAHLP